MNMITLEELVILMMSWEEICKVASVYGIATENRTVLNVIRDIVRHRKERMEDWK